MPKPDIEYLDVDTMEWEPIDGEDGAWMKILSFDEVTGSHTRLLKIDPGHETEKILAHDFWEETYTIKGYIIDLGLNKMLKEGTYSCVPPGKKHGPYKCPEGCITLEFRYYS